MLIGGYSSAGVKAINQDAFTAHLPEGIERDLKGAAAAAKLGQTFVEANRSSKSTAVIKQLSERILGASEEEIDVDAPEKKSLLGGFDLKSLLAKKDKKPVAEPAE